VIANQRIRLQQIIREAEGYLELSLLFARDFDTSLARKLVTPRALETLAKIDATGNFRGHALYLQGEALRSLERYAEAVQPLREASELDPENIQIWLALGWCYKRSGRLDLAIESMERAMEVSDDALDVEKYRALLHYNLACYWSLAGNKAHALEYLSKAFDADPDYRDRVGSEPDFDPLRSDPDFQALTSLLA
jgi:tetratricopeptide (TPR) repeat protein